MTDDPFLTLVIEALNLTHPRFAAADMPREFYHQFRRLWDKALPVKLGLGHVVLQADPALPPGVKPDFLFWQLGEHGQPDRRLGAVSFGPDGETLAKLRSDPGYPHAVRVIVGKDVDGPGVSGVTTIVFDTERWQAVIPMDQEDRL